MELDRSCVCGQLYRSKKWWRHRCLSAECYMTFVEIGQGAGIGWTVEARSLAAFTVHLPETATYRYRGRAQLTIVQVCCKGMKHSSSQESKVGFARSSRAEADVGTDGSPTRSPGRIELHEQHVTSAMLGRQVLYLNLLCCFKRMSTSKLTFHLSLWLCS